MMRWCEDIGMHAFDRPIYDTDKVKGSCNHASDYCKQTCYNMKLYKIYPAMHDKDVRNEASWQSITGEGVAKFLSRKRKPTNRARFMTRGEAFKDYSDIPRVLDIVRSTPNIFWWAPTRAWRDKMLWNSIMIDLKEVTNIAILASTDPTTTKEEWAWLKANGISTMFYGDDTMTTTPMGDRFFKCPKTHKKLKGHCGICKAGCFAPVTLKREVHVHLSKH